MSQDPMNEAIIKSLQTRHGRNKLRALIINNFPEEIANPLIDCINGDIMSLSETEEAITDNILDAILAEKISTEQAEQMIHGDLSDEFMSSLVNG